MNYEQVIIYSAIVIAAIAVAGRLIINRQQRSKTIDWYRIFVILAAVVALIGGYYVFPAHEAAEGMKGIATQKEAARNDIAGRKGALDIEQFRADMESPAQLFYRMKPDSLSFTGFYMQKAFGSADVDREEQENENGGAIIKRKQNKFAITKNPADKDDYMQIYVAYLDGQKVLLAAPASYEEDLLETGLVARYTYLDAKQLRIAQQNGCQEQCMLVCFSQRNYTANSTLYIIYRLIFGIVVAIMTVAALLVVKRI